MLMELARFKRLAVDVRKGAAGARRPSTDTVVRKDYLGPTEVLGDRQLRFTISSSAVDRALDVIDQGGWDLSGFRRNPVVLWQHNSWDMPIGKCIDIGLEAGALRATIEFVRADVPSGLGELADTVLALCKEGFLSATSVGFRPIEFEVTSDPSRGADDWLPGFDFRKQDLTEFSIVTVPCNTDAMIDPQHRDTPAGSMSGLLPNVAAAPDTSLRTKTVRRLTLDTRLRAGLPARTTQRPTAAPQ